jgi:hypothetical protein
LELLDQDGSGDVVSFATSGQQTCTDSLDEGRRHNLEEIFLSSVLLISSCSTIFPKKKQKFFKRKEQLCSAILSFNPGRLRIFQNKKLTESVSVGFIPLTKFVEHAATAQITRFLGTALSRKFGD